INNICSDKHILFAYTIPHFAENQMNSMEKSAQGLFLKLLSPIIGSGAEILNNSSQSLDSQKEPNASIHVFLFAGQVPFTLTFHEHSTVDNWGNHLEAATSLLLPQVIFKAEQMLPKYASQIMRRALVEEVYSWQKNRPSVGDIREWEWNPKLI
ncbi:MAG: hypothetical protein ABFS32_23465, partial [Bacteroidota bacterium]